MEPTQLSYVEIKKRIIPSFMSLTARQIVLRAIAFVSLNIILAKILPVETLGIFNIAISVITFFAYFSDVGLAASLIQKKKEVTNEDIKTVFTIQQVLVTIISAVIIIAAPILGGFYNLNNDGVWLIRVLGIAFFLTSLKVVPSVILERNLKFQSLVTIEIVETLVFNVLLIILVFANMGIWSFSIAAFSRSMIGTFLIYILAPVPVGFKINKEAAKKLLSYGIPFQMNSLLALLKDKLVPLVVAGMVGPLGIGYVTWAQAMAFLPLEMMNIVIRITFPAFSRLQNDKEILGKAVEKSLFATSLMVYPVLFGLGAVMPALISFVVSPKWLPALPSFYLFAFSTYWAVISTTLTNTLNATGYVKHTLKLMIMWTALTWVLTPILVYYYNFIGVAITSFIISFTSLVTIILVKRILAVRVLDAIFIPTLASCVMGVSVFFITINFVRSVFTLSLVILFGAVLYFSIMMLFKKEIILDNLRKLRSV